MSRRFPTNHALCSFEQARTTRIRIYSGSKCFQPRDTGLPHILAKRPPRVLPVQDLQEWECVEEWATLSAILPPAEIDVRH